MSTKIHNGYYIDKCTLEGLHELCRLLRREMENERVRLYATRLMSTAVRIMDAAHLHNAGLYSMDSLSKETQSIDGQSPITAAHEIILERSTKIERTKLRDPEYDFDFNVTFVPIDGLEEKDTNLLAMIFTEQRSYVEIWEKQPVVHPFFYWDNTDKPTEIPETEWDLRRDAWEVVEIPSLQGFSAQLTHPYLPLPTEGILEHAEKVPYEGRVANAVWAILMTQYIKDNEIKLTATNFRQTRRMVEEWVKTPDGMCEQQAINAKVRKVLKKPITTQLLTIDIKLNKQVKTRAHYIEWEKAGSEP